MITKSQLAKRIKEEKEDPHMRPAWVVLRELLIEAISDRERKVFELVKEVRGGISVEGITIKMDENETSNVSTYLRRLVGWGLLQREKVDGVFYYYE